MSQQMIDADLGYVWPVGLTSVPGAEDAVGAEDPVLQVEFSFFYKFEDAHRRDWLAHACNTKKAGGGDWLAAFAICNSEGLVVDERPFTRDYDGKAGNVESAHEVHGDGFHQAVFRRRDIGHPR
jgi:hypothetical protein